MGSLLTTPINLKLVVSGATDRIHVTIVSCYFCTSHDAIGLQQVKSH